MGSHFATSNAQGLRAGAVRLGASFKRALDAILGHARSVGESPARNRQFRGISHTNAGGAAAAETFSDVSKLMQSSASYEDAFGMARRRAAASFADCSGALYVAPIPGGKLEMVAAWGKDAGCGNCFDAADCRVTRTGEAQFAAADMACAGRQQSLRAPSLCMPIEAHGAMLGVLMLQEGAVAGSLAASRPVAAGFSEQIALALANMRLRDTLRKLSGRDPLDYANESRPQTSAVQAQQI